MRKKYGAAPTLSWREFAEYLVSYIEGDLGEHIEPVYAAIKDETQSLLPWEDDDADEDSETLSGRPRYLDESD